MNLLIVDDHATNRKLLRAQLEGEGHRVVEAAHGMEALEVLDRQDVDGIVSDILMPNMDGYRLCLEIRKKKKLSRLPFIFYTSTYTSPQDQQLAGTVGADKYITKPSPVRVILGALEEAMQKTRDRIAVSAARQDEGYVLKQYNEALVRKLEERNLEIEDALRRIQATHTQLSASEARFRALVENGFDAISMIGADGAVLYRSPAASRILGYSMDELLHQSTFDIVHPDDLAAAKQQFQSLLRKPSENTHGVTRYRHKDGSWRWLEGTATNLLDQPEVRAIVINFRDVTERIRQEHRIERLSRVRAVTSEINAAIVRARSRQELFDEACRIAVQHGRFGIVWIGTIDTERQEIVPVASAGLEDSSFLMHIVSSLRADSPQAHGVIQRTVRTRRPVYSNDIAVDAAAGGKRREEALRRGYRSVIGLPLVGEGSVVGSFSMFAKELNFFDEEEVKLLNELAGNISFALDHLARQEKLEKLSRVRDVLGGINTAIVRIRERDSLLSECCRIISGQGRFEMVWVGSIESEKQKIHPVAWNGFSAETAHSVNWTSVNAARGPIGRAIAAKKVSVLNDIHGEMPTGVLRQEALARGCLSAVGLPLIVEDRAVALIAIYAGGRGFFDREELALLDQVTSNISLALEHMARQEKIEKLSRIRAVSSEVNAAIVRVRESESLLQEICRIASEHGKFGLVWVGEIDQANQRVRPVASAGVSREAVHAVNWATINAAKGALGEAVRTRKTAVRGDIELEMPSGRLRQEALEAGCRSTICLPVVVDDKVVALIALFAPGSGFFDEDELALLTEMTADVSFALQSIAQQEKVEYLSYYDTVTGLPNRRLFMDRAGQQMHARGSDPLMVALVIFNLERFRYINETYGRNGGDKLLNQVARRLESAARGKDHLARIGADNFGAVIRGVRDATAVLRTVEGEILACFQEPFKVNDAEVRIAARAGIAMYPADGAGADALFANAEAALKKARASRERLLFYSADMNARAAQVVSLETRLRKAVEAREFALHYQPKIELATGAICGLEALLRWQEPGGGLGSPGTFIPVLEETGLILEVGKWALEQALAQHRDWRSRGCPAPRVAVNVSAIQLQRREFADMVIDAVQQHGDNPDALEIEVTESLLMKDVQASIRKLSILRGMGIQIAMDDFGTGYSSLSYIARLPLNSLKIDRSFIIGMTGSPQDTGIVTTIIALAHSLKLRVVAEGVEHEDQARLLRLFKCDEAQGYLFSKPLPATEIEDLLRAPEIPPFAAGGPEAAA